MERKNYKSDFKFYLRSNLLTSPFVFRYYTSASRDYVVSHVNGEWKNCKMMSDGRLMVVFDNHGLKPGVLRVEKMYYLTDSDFADGICNLVSTEEAGIILTIGKTDEVEEEISFPSSAITAREISPYEQPDIVDALIAYDEEQARREEKEEESDNDNI